MSTHDDAEVRLLNTTSIGSVVIGLLTLVLGVGLLVAGSAAVMEFGFAGSYSYEEEHGPWGIFGSEEGQASFVHPVGVLGGLLAMLGVVLAGWGLLHTGRSLERGKDREVQLRTLHRDE